MKANKIDKSMLKLMNLFIVNTISLLLANLNIHKHSKQLVICFFLLLIKHNYDVYIFQINCNKYFHSQYFHFTKVLFFCFGNII